MFRRFNLLKWSPLLFFILALSIFLVLYLRFQRKPEILEISSLIAAEGEEIELTGRFFGDSSDGAELLIGGQIHPSTGIISWSNDKISFRVLRRDSAVLIKVKTRSGLSNAVVLGDSTRFPQVQYGSWLPGAPFVEYMNPQSGGPGSLVLLQGSGFGHRQTGGSIWVNRSDPSTSFDQVQPKISHYIEASNIELWSDQEIRFRIPPQSSSGNIYVEKNNNFSNPLYFEITSSQGSFSFEEEILWSLRQELILDRVGALPGNRIFIRLPLPVPGPGQKAAAVIDAKGNPDALLLRREGYLDIYRIAELQNGKNYTISRQIIVSTSRVRVNVNLDAASTAASSIDTGNPEISAALEDDEWIKPSSVPGVSRRIAGNIRGDWQKSFSLYKYVLDTLSWSDNPPDRNIPEYLNTGLADSEGYSFLYCSLLRAAGIPARPVGGIVIDLDGLSRPWWWTEIWMEGLGWVPVDPAMADSTDEKLLFAGSSERRDFYFGGLDARHVAFSRGILESRQMQPDTELKIPEKRYTLQAVWEEISGNLYSYKTAWRVPETKAFYQ